MSQSQSQSHSQYEKLISNALYSDSHKLSNILSNLIPSISNVIPICREAHLVSERKTVDSKFFIAGYATGWRAIKTDILAYAKLDNSHLLIPIEMKIKLSKGSFLQILEYAYSLLTTLIPKAHSQLANIYKFYLDKIFQIKKLDFLNQPHNYENLIIQPIIIYLNGKDSNHDHNHNHNHNYNNEDLISLSTGLKRLIDDYNIQVNPIKNHGLPDIESKNLLHKYKNLRIDHVSNL